VLLGHGFAAESAAAFMGVLAAMFALWTLELNFAIWALSWANISSFIYAFFGFLLPYQFCQEDIPSFVARLAPQPAKAGSES
jgi:hypothetical protein